MSEKYCIEYLNKIIHFEKSINYTIGRAEENDIHIPDAAVSRKHAEIVWKKMGFMIRDLGSTNGTFVNSIRITEKSLSDGDKIRAGNSNLLFRIIDKTDTEQVNTHQPTNDTMIMEKQIADIMDNVDDPMLYKKLRGLKDIFMKNKMQLVEQAFKDTLTGLYNRRFFDKTLDDEIQRAQRYNRDLSLIMIDIDHFKKFNDTYGHQKGDDVLHTVASILIENSRNSDIVARYGGEEMSIILPETPVDKAALVGEKIRSKVEANTDRREGVKITISIGVAGLNAKNKNAEEIISSADAALYTAKNEGRNRVCTNK